MKSISAIPFLLIGLLNCKESEFMKSSKSENMVIENLPVATESSVISERNPFDDIESRFASFKATEALEDSSKITFNAKNSLATDVTLKNSYSTLTDYSYQKIRGDILVEKTQGSDGLEKTVILPIGTAEGKLDLLLVVDNSGSMKTEQENLSTKLGPLLSSVEDADWKLAVTTTDTDDPCIAAPLITKADYLLDPSKTLKKFRDLINDLGTKGSGNELGFYRARQALSDCPSIQNNWVREDSTLAILIISDEDNCSTGLCYQRNLSSIVQPWSYPEYLTDYIYGPSMGRTRGVNVEFYGLFDDPDAPKVCEKLNNPGKQYKLLTGDNFGSICDNDYSATLSKMSENISTLIQMQWAFPYTPDPGTLAVELRTLDGQVTLLQSTQYSVKNQRLILTTALEGKELRVTFKTGFRPKFTTIDLGSLPDLATLKVKINNTLLAASAYTVTGKTLSFLQEVPENNLVQVSAKKNTPLLTSFPVTGNPKDNKITVTVNNQIQTDYQYNSELKQVIFQNPPSDGAKIAITYTNNNGAILTYPITIGGTNPRNFKVFADTRPLTVTWKNNAFVLQPQDHQEGLTLKVTYDVADTMEKSFQLPYMPIPGSIKISSSANCSLDKEIKVQGQTLTSTCVVPNADSFDISYSYQYIGARTTYPIPGVKEPEKGVWRVYVNGELYSDFTREANTITLAGTLDPEDIIEIHYTFE